MTRTIGACVLAAGLAARGGAEEAAKKPVPLYTNEDLRRFSMRGEAATEPEGPAESPAPARGARAARGEAYWRRQAEIVRERLLPLRSSAAELRVRIAAVKAEFPPRRGTGTRLAEWESRLQALEHRIRSTEASLEERARRAGALPGWLR